MAETKQSPTIVELARMLAQGSGEAITPEQIAKDIEAGCPIDDDGRVNPLLYAAWLLKVDDNRIRS